VSPVSGAGASPLGAAGRPLEARKAEDPALREAARQFEGLFVSKLLQQALGGDREGGGLCGQGPGADVYQGMLETFLSEHLSRGGGLGLADSLVRDLGGGQ
jgi:flagellar protein FlgJ